MTVSVIMTCHNEERYIEQAIRSVASQTAFDVVGEIIVVNDGSTDGSQRVLERLAGEVNKLCIIEAPGVGPSAARNIALRAARGELVAILDGDDFWTPNRLAVQLPAFVDWPQVGLVYGDFVDFSLDDAADARIVTVRRYPAESDTQLLDYFINDAPIMPSTIVVRRAVFDSVGLFDETLRIGEDTEFFLRTAAKWRFCYVPGAHTFKRRRAGQITQRLDVLLPNAVLVTQRFCAAYPALRRFADRRMARFHTKVGIDCAMRGEYRAAVRHSMTAIAMAPLFWRAWVNLLLLSAPVKIVRPAYTAIKAVFHRARQGRRGIGRDVLQHSEVVGPGPSVRRR